MFLVKYHFSIFITCMVLFLYPKLSIGIFEFLFLENSYLYMMEFPGIEPYLYLPLKNRIPLLITPISKSQSAFH